MENYEIKNAEDYPQLKPLIPYLEEFEQDLAKTKRPTSI